MADRRAMETGVTMARWDELRERWALDADEEAGLLGGGALDGPVGAAISWRPQRLEERMRLLADLGGALDVLLIDGCRIRCWLRGRRHSMGGHSPIEAMSSSAEWIRRLLGVARDFMP